MPGCSSTVPSHLVTHQSPSCLGQKPIPSPSRPSLSAAPAPHTLQLRLPLGRHSPDPSTPATPLLGDLLLLVCCKHHVPQSSVLRLWPFSLLAPVPGLQVPPIYTYLWPRPLPIPPKASSLPLSPTSVGHSGWSSCSSYKRWASSKLILHNSSHRLIPLALR